MCLWCGKTFHHKGKRLISDDFTSWHERFGRTQKTTVFLANKLLKAANR